MMKTILLLAFTVFVSCAPAANSNKTPVKRIPDKTLLGELVDELITVMKDFPKENEEKQIFLKDLQMNGMCSKEREVLFCQAEQELKTKVSGLSGAKFDHFRFDKKLMRNLNMYNKHHVKTCKPADEDQVKIPLHTFLKNLLTCVKSAFSQAK